MESSKILKNVKLVHSKKNCNKKEDFKVKIAILLYNYRKILEIQSFGTIFHLNEQSFSKSNLQLFMDL